MEIFKRVLFPVDLSEASARMVPMVKEIVDRFGAKLHVIHAKPVDQYYIATFVDETQLHSTPDEEGKLNEFIASNFDSPDIIVSLLMGPPGPEIIRYAEDEGIDLIVMGHSSTGIARAVFGSVAGHVTKYSQVPVLIIGPNILKKT
jgi:nucleotide-binding universal stress UspA family protein